MVTFPFMFCCSFFSQLIYISEIWRNFAPMVPIMLCFCKHQVIDHCKSCWPGWQADLFCFFAAFASSSSCLHWFWWLRVNTWSYINYSKMTSSELIRICICNEPGDTTGKNLIRAAGVIDWSSDSQKKYKIWLVQRVTMCIKGKDSMCMMTWS